VKFMARTLVAAGLSLRDDARTRPVVIRNWEGGH
jgi:hypothetical protein